MLYLESLFGYSWSQAGGENRNLLVPHRLALVPTLGPPPLFVGVLSRQTLLGGEGVPTAPLGLVRALSPLDGHDWHGAPCFTACMRCVDGDFSSAFYSRA